MRRIDPARQQVGRALVVVPEHLPLEALAGRAVGDHVQPVRQRPAQLVDVGREGLLVDRRDPAGGERARRRRRAGRAASAGIASACAGSRRSATARPAPSPRAATPGGRCAGERRSGADRSRSHRRWRPASGPRPAPGAAARPAAPRSASTSAPASSAGLAPGPESTTCAPSLALGGAAAQAFERRQAEQRLGRATAEVSIQSFISVREGAGAAGRSRRTAAAPRARW